MKIILFIITSFYFTNTFAIFGHWKIKCGPIKINNDHTGGKTHNVTEAVANPIGYLAKEALCTVGNVVVKNPESRRQLREYVSWGCDPVYKTTEMIINSNDPYAPGPYETEAQLIARLKEMPDRLVDVDTLIKASSPQENDWSCGANSGCRLINYYPGRKTNYSEMCDGLTSIDNQYVNYVETKSGIDDDSISDFKEQFAL